MLLRRYLRADAGIKTLAAMRFRIGRIHEANDPSEFVADYRTKEQPLPASWTKFLTSRVKEDRTAKMGMLCFSGADVSDQLMWGHYAEGGRGVCFEVESDHLGFEANVLFPVNYDVPPVIEVADLLDERPENQANRERLMMRVLKTKSCVWKYEAEQRAFLELKGETTVDPCTNSVSFYAPINPPAIRAIYLGAAAEDKTVIAISDLIRHHQLRIELKRMELHAPTGQLVAQSIS